VAKVLTGQGSKANDALTISTGFAILTFNHTVSTTVGSTAVLSSDRDIAVGSETTQKTALIAQGNIDSNNKDKKFALGAAVAIGFYANDVDTLVDSGAVIDAAGKLSVDAELTYPLLVTPLSLLPFSSFYTDGGAESDDLPGDLSALLDGSLGLSRILNVWVTTKARGPDAQSAAFAITGSIGVVNYDNHVASRIATGARINQDASVAGPQQSVEVMALTAMQIISAAGIINVSLNDVGVRSLLSAKAAGEEGWLGQPFSLLGNEAGTLGIGGSFIIQNFTNDTTALIEDGVLIGSATGGSVTVQATTDIETFEFVQAGGYSGNVGISGSLSLVEQVGSTLAQIDTGATVFGGALAVNAHDTTSHVTVAGAVQEAKAVGIGATVTYTDVTRTTNALLGAAWLDFTGSAINITGNSITLPNHKLTTGDRVIYRLRAANIAPAGGLVDGQEYFAIVVDSNTIQLALTPQDATNGNAVSLSATANTTGHSFEPSRSVIPIAPGTIAGNTITQANHGFATGQALLYRNFGGPTAQVTGLVDGQIYFVIVINANQYRLAATQAAARQIVPTALTISGPSTTGSRFERALGIDAASIAVAATADGNMWAFGVAGALVSSTQTADPVDVDEAEGPANSGVKGRYAIGVTGVTLFEYVTDNTRASISGPTSARSAGDVSVTAENATNITSAAGAGTYARSTNALGLAGAAAITEINRTTEAFLTSSAIPTAGTLTVSATESGKIIAVAAGVAGSINSKVAVDIAGSVAYNTINSATHVIVADNAITTTGASTITTSDTTKITAVAGAGAFAVNLSKE